MRSVIARSDGDKAIQLVLIAPDCFAEFTIEPAKPDPLARNDGYRSYEKCRTIAAKPRIQARVFSTSSGTGSAATRTITSSLMGSI